MNDKTRLDREAWIHAGLRGLSERGPAALRAEPLARELGVSKGSFYWHFVNLAAFEAAIIDYWVAVATRDIIDEVESGAQGAAERLALLVERSTEPPPAAVGGRRVEGAIRCWARGDTRVGERLREVDAARLAFCAALFRAHGLPAAQARQRGRLLYAGLIGLEQLDLAELAELRRDLQALLARLL